MPAQAADRFADEALPYRRQLYRIALRLTGNAADAEDLVSADTAVAAACELFAGEWHGDLRRLRDAGEGNPGRIAGLLAGFPGIGPAGASIFLREVQEAWPVVAPSADARVTEGAGRVGLPTGRDELVQARQLNRDAAHPLSDLLGHQA